MIRKLTLYILTLILISSCIKNNSDDINYRYKIGKVEQTTIVYYIGTSLGSFFNGNISDIQTAIAEGGLGNNGRLYVLLANYSYSTLYELYEEDGVCKKFVVEKFKNNVTLSEDMMLDVIGKVKNIAPANTYNLILGGHGTGWVPYDFPLLKSASTSQITNQTFGTQEVEGLTRFMGSHEDKFMNIEELSDILTKSETTFGYILFDMCFMSNIETLYELRNVCNNIVASPCEVMAHGFPYDEMLKYLFDNDGMSTNYAEVCNAYYNYYNEESSYESGAVAWCNCTELKSLADVVSQINENGVNEVDIKELQCYEMLPYNVFCDFGQYINYACDDLILKLKFEIAMEQAFPINSRLHTDSFYTNLSGSSGWVDIDYYSGVTTSAPSEKFRHEWSNTEWAKDSNSNR